MEDEYTTQKQKELDDLTTSLLGIDAQLEELEKRIKMERTKAASEAS